MKMGLHRERHDSFFLQNCDSIPSRMECHIEVLLTTKEERSREPYSQQAWQNCFHSWNVLVHASSSVHCGWACQVKLQTFTWGVTQRTLVTTARTTHLPELKETIHMIFLCKRKPVQEVFMILLTFQHKIVWQFVWQKSSAKVDNLFTPVKTWKLLEVDVHPNFRTLMEHKDCLSTWCKQFMHTREKMFSSWRLQGFLRHQLHWNDHSKWCLWELPWALRVKMVWKQRLFSQTHAPVHPWRWWHCTRTWMQTSFFSVSHLPFLLGLWQCRHQGPLESEEPIGGRKTLLNTVSASRTTTISLWLSPDTVDLEFDEEVMIPERLTEALDKAGFHPDTMKVSKWYQGRVSSVTFDTSHLPVALWHFCWNRLDVIPTKEPSGRW